MLLLLGLLGCKKPDSRQKEVGQPLPVAPVAAAPVAAAPAPSLAAVNRAAAKAANVQGMKAYQAKDHAAAAAHFRAAIAADPGFPLPRYNLACVAALTGDKATARAQLEWLMASRDPQARRTLRKASSDPDLKNLSDDAASQKILQWSGVFPGFRASLLEIQETEEDAKRLAKEAGERSSECDGDDKAAFTVVRAIKGELVAERPGLETLLVSLADGALLLDATGKVVARGEPLDKDCVGGSQAGLMRVAAGQVVADEDPEFVLYSSGGGHGDGYVEEVTVLKRRGDKLELILGATIEGTDKQELSVEGPGTIRHRGAEEKQALPKRWDPATFAFVALPDPAVPAPVQAPAPEAKKPPEDSAPTEPAENFEELARVNGWTEDSNSLSYKAELWVGESEESFSPGRVLINVGVVFDGRTGQKQRYLLGTDGELEKSEKAQFASYQKKAAFKAWGKEHPTRCIDGRTSPDGKTTANIKVASKKRKRASGSWKKNQFNYSYDNPDDEGSEESTILLTMTLVRDGKTITTDSWTGGNVLGGSLGGHVTLCWSPDSQRAAWIVHRERGMMRDTGESKLIVAGSGNGTPASAPGK